MCSSVWFCLLLCYHRNAGGSLRVVRNIIVICQIYFTFIIEQFAVGGLSGEFNVYCFCFFVVVEKKLEPRIGRGYNFKEAQQGTLSVGEERLISWENVGIEF